MKRVSSSRQIMPSSMMWPRSFSRSTYRARPGRMSCTWFGYRRSSASTTSGPETTILPRVETSPTLTPWRTASYSARVAVGPRPPPAAEAVEPRAEAEVLAVERRAAEGVDVAARGGLGQREPQGRRPGRERGGDGARAVGQVGPQVGQADGPLAGAGAAEAGPLGQRLQLPEAAVPHAVDVLDRRPGARADDTVDGRRRQVVLLGGRTDDPHVAVGRDAGQDVAWRRAEADHDGPAGVGLEDAVVVEHRGRRPRRRHRRRGGRAARPPRGPAAHRARRPPRSRRAASRPPACAVMAADVVRSPRRRLPGQTGCRPVPRPWPARPRGRGRGRSSTRPSSSVTRTTSVGPWSMVTTSWPSPASSTSINTLTGADSIAPFGGAAFHDNRVWIRPAATA